MSEQAKVPGSEVSQRWVIWRFADHLPWHVHQRNTGGVPNDVQEIEVMPVAEHDAQWEAELAMFQESQQRMAAAYTELRRAIVEHRTAIDNAGSIKVRPGYEQVAEAKHRADERLWRHLTHSPDGGA